MIYEISALLILIFSFLGIVVVLWRKIPLLVKLSQEDAGSGGVFSALKEKVNDTSFMQKFSLETFLQKVLSKIRVLIIKTENKISHWLQQLREKSQQKKLQENDDYWKRLKKLTRRGKKQN